MPHGGNYGGSATREDRVHSPTLQVAYTMNRTCRLEALALFDRAESRLPQTAGLEFRRQYVAVATTLTR